MSSDEKQRYLDMKYEYVEDKAISGKKKSKRRSHKKEKHRHDYQNCVFEFYVSLFSGGQRHPFVRLGSYCSICGKISEYRDDGKLKRFGCKTKFSPFADLNYAYSMTQEERERLIEYCKKTYPVFYMDPFDNKYVPVVKECE